MIRSAVTISLVAEARGGPFVYWDDLEEGCRRAAGLGFDAVEIFPPAPDAIPAAEVRPVVERYGLKVAAVGTGAGWVKHRLRLTDPDAAVRERAVAFVRAVIDAGGALGAPAIIGSMQGRWGEGTTRDEGLAYLADALRDLGRHANERYGLPLLYEPLNRYETNMACTVGEGAAIVRALGGDAGRVMLLCDLFHMSIEEVDVAAALRAGGALVGHVHLADSNRRPAGGGHTDFAPIVAALREIEYDGYLSAECLPYPDSDAAARQTMAAFRRLTHE